MRTAATVLAITSILSACASSRPEPNLVDVANGAGEKCYDAVRAALEPQGITPHCLGSVRFGISVEAREAARARALLKPLCADPDLYLILVP
jgi:hypothetical protein